MWNIVQVKQLPKIFVYRDQNPILRFRQLQQGPVAGVRANGLGRKRVMPVTAQPIGQTTAGAPINQKAHHSATETVASVSLAMTAWA